MLPTFDILVYWSPNPFFCAYLFIFLFFHCQLQLCTVSESNAIIFFFFFSLPTSTSGLLSKDICQGAETSFLFRQCPRLSVPLDLRNGHFSRHWRIILLASLSPSYWLFPPPVSLVVFSSPRLGNVSFCWPLFSLSFLLGPVVLTKGYSSSCYAHAATGRSQYLSCKKLGDDVLSFAERPREDTFILAFSRCLWVLACMLCFILWFGDFFTWMKLWLFDIVVLSSVSCIRFIANQSTWLQKCACSQM